MFRSLDEILDPRVPGLYSRFFISVDGPSSPRDSFLTMSFFSSLRLHSWSRIHSQSVWHMSSFPRFYSIPRVICHSSLSLRLHSIPGAVSLFIPILDALLHSQRCLLFILTLEALLPIHLVGPISRGFIFPCQGFVPFPNCLMYVLILEAILPIHSVFPISRGFISRSW